jgi:hypothetical protein
MKLDLLKKLIKEAVGEAVREELSKILSEDVRPSQPARPSVMKYENYKPVTAKPIPTGDPIMDLLNETRATMTSAPDSGYRPDISSMIQAPGLGMESMMEDNFARPEVGIDLSQLDFVKNAGAIYKASVQKDKERFGA